MEGAQQRQVSRRNLLRASGALAGLLVPARAETARAMKPSAAAQAADKMVTLNLPADTPPRGDMVFINTRMVFDRLFDLAADGTWIPMLAEQWTWGEEARSITFALRKGVTFHDGTPLTAKDVVTSIKVIDSPHMGGDVGDANRLVALTGVQEYANDETDEIAGLKIVDDHTITFEFDRPAAGFFAYSAFGREGVNILPAHIWEPQLAKARAGEISIQERQNPWYWTEEAQIGTGAFRWLEGEPEQFIRLGAVADSWHDTPQLDTILLQNFGEADTQFLAFQRGELDALYLLPTFEEQVTAMEGVQVDSWITHYIQVLTVNCLDNGYGLTDPLVRQALSSAINREAINDGLYLGLHEPTAAVLQGEWNDPETPQFPYDPDTATRLLEESGFDLDRELVLGWSYEGTLFQQLIEAIQADLQAVGFNVRLLFREEATVADVWASGEWTAFLDGYAIHPSPYVLGEAHVSGSVLDYGHCGTPELDAKLAAVNAMFDPAAQKEAWSEIQGMIQTSSTHIPIWRRGAKIAYQGRFTGWDGNTTAAFSQNSYQHFGAEKWSVA